MAEANASGGWLSHLFELRARLVKVTVAVISLWQQAHSTSGGVSLTMLAGMAGTGSFYRYVKLYWLGRESRRS